MKVMDDPQVFVTLIHGIIAAGRISFRAHENAWECRPLFPELHIVYTTVQSKILLFRRFPNNLTLHDSGNPISQAY